MLMIPKKIKKHFPKIILVLVVIGCVEAVNIFLTVRAKRLLRNDLLRNVTRMTDGLYSLDFGNLDINLVGGAASINDIRLRLNTDRLNELYERDSLPHFYGSLTVKSLKLEGVNFMYRNWKRKELEFRRIRILSPQVIMNDNVDGIPVVKPGKSKVKNKSLYEMIAPYLNAIAVEEIRLENGSVKFQLEDDTDTTFVQLNNLRFEAEHFRIDSLSDRRAWFLYSENFRLSIDSSTTHLPGKLYSLRTGKVAVSLQDSSLQIKDIHYVSRVPKWEFAYQDPLHSDWMDVLVGTVALKNFRLQQLVEEKSLAADSVLISDVYFSNYKNQKIPVEHLLVPVVYEQLQKFPLPFRIREVQVSNVHVLYEELAKDGTDPGAIRFTEMSGVFHGFTNIISSHTQTNTLLATGKLMNEGLIHAELSFPVDPAYDTVTIRGTLGVMDMIALNKIIEPLAPARIRSGFVQGLEFYIVGGKERATIDMCLLYNDLSVQILQQADGQRTQSGILSLLANSFLKKNNPESGEAPRRVRTESIRDPYHSSFNYLWKILFSGLAETLGYTEDWQKNVTWLQSEFKKPKKK